MGTTLAELLDLARTGPRAFRARSPQPSTPQVFGGQFVAQALVAAGRDVPSDQGPHSLHAHFLEPGDPASVLDLMVEPVRGGVGRTVRRVSVRQHGRELVTVLASFAGVRPGLGHEAVEPGTSRLAHRGAPSRGVSAPDLRGGLAEASEETLSWVAALRAVLPLEVAFPEPPPRDAVVRGERPPPHQRVLVRAADPLPADPLVHAAALAYASDLLLLSTALLPHGMVMGDPRARAVSLDHTLWFHRAPRADDWLDHAMESEWAGDGRAVCHGRMRDPAGRLLATVAQEGTLRPRAG
ncbi:acyl-CoA thioesterase II [Pseudonocardia sp. KRD291]|uniref:acyl-CoA thioesterase n=1 Tax=Pseudonocardia sp. KRD291 TaxID=2792007 RepID=UPI001C4A2822|nr:acyl-CoA thioesterase domain-containing protein [Pseudonocardia sp. KRD291]MBW0102617.1 thioesterase family protein [Pseudonocardia sp. KRD291]